MTPPHRSDSRPPRPAAYRVPFRVDRSSAPWFRLVNVGEAPVRGVTLTELDAHGGIVAATSPSRLLPGQSVPFSLRSRNPHIGSVVVVRWFRLDGAEFVWRVSFAEC